MTHYRETGMTFRFLCIIFFIEVSQPFDSYINIPITHAFQLFFKTTVIKAAATFLKQRGFFDFLLTKGFPISPIILPHKNNCEPFIETFPPYISRRT